VICSTKVLSQEDTILFTKGFLDSINIDDLLKSSPKKSYFKIQASYLCNSVYGGRKDSLALPYFTPSIEYNHKSGFYASTSLGLLPNSNFNRDFFSLDAGFSFNTSHRFGASVFANKLFYSDSSKNVQSSVDLSVGTTLTYNASIINFSSVITAMFGSKTDVAVSLSADHSFDFESNTNNYSFSVTPTISTYFGTTGNYQNYQQKLRTRKNKPPRYITTTSTSPNKFQLMSFECSLPFYYDKLHWGIFFIPTYSIAVNPIITNNKATGPNGGNILLPIQGYDLQPTETEKLSNTFFAELGFYYRF
jgi:hypothetical protein